MTSASWGIGEVMVPGLRHDPTHRL
jgi:hypothetical protein